MKIAYSKFMLKCGVGAWVGMASKPFELWKTLSCDAGDRGQEAPIA